ncbi:type III polyketide synthase [Arthrobacter agilis]|uniref:type III polyketide synthase n=1 Tax=Arthrobacter agilis TaxID=37921 RepID=UPI000B364268|nr:type III polyketide synthase [Arthrobacter agilis]OUM40714.1 type III polyketide synthase [Arthrobacter agilis]PPB45322.1 type III polyketide synthase [Arthrobacter agilis]TPV28031.1 type III polyketide synthase [Arthrobacter agilis]
MTVILRSLETAVPETVMVQPQVRDVFAAQPGLTRLGQRLVGAAFDSSGIETRYTAVKELTVTEAFENPVFFDQKDMRILTPSTKTRNEVYAEEGTKLFVEAAQKALDAATGIDASDVTHVVTVSCTGFFAPGPDYKVVRALGLEPSVQRYHLGFMGCYAAFPALRSAKAFCEADPDAVVLVISAELCSLHVRSSNNPDTIVGSSLFADGAAAAIISARDLPLDGPALSLDHFETVLTPVGEESMAWNIGDEGFEMVLGTYVPHIIDEHIIGALEPLLARDASLQGLDYSEIEHWAIHPGGRSILDKVEAKLGLSEHQLVPARETLRDYGNMSSATVMFVLKNILEQPATDGNNRICSMAFGPGLTVETALLTRIGATPDDAAQHTDGAAAVPTARTVPADLEPVLARAGA